MKYKASKTNTARSWENLKDVIRGNEVVESWRPLSNSFDFEPRIGFSTPSPQLWPTYIGFGLLTLSRFPRPSSRKQK